jgi:DNA-binding GntR family transcriptional regulator
MTGMDRNAFLDVGQPRVTTYEFVHDTLRRAILGGALPGGTRLVQADIANQLSVSTTPVREALRDLASEGLVVFRAHIGAMVRELDADELVELYDIRKSLEPVTIRRATARITPEELARAHELGKEMEQETDPGAWAALNRQFHGVLEDAAQAPFIQSVLKGVHDIAAIYVAHALILQPSRMGPSNKEHRTLLAAVRRNDADAAAALLVAHLDTSLQAVLKSQSDGAHRAPGQLLSSRVNQAGLVSSRDRPLRPTRR